MGFHEILDELVEIFALLCFLMLGITRMKMIVVFGIRPRREVINLGKGVLRIGTFVHYLDFISNLFERYKRFEGENDLIF